MANRPFADDQGRRGSAKSAGNGRAMSGGQDFAAMDKAIADGAIAVFCDIKTPPFAAQSELIDIKIVLPSKWSSELVERIEACIDEFGEQKGIGKTHVTDEGPQS